ncbi:hypothetical protein IMSAGC009_04582 [Lachnospiraceae bacterium]|nr:hypothetical protein IMSAGC009_04582 [Lachnospiraceae bacterium]
MQKLPVKAVQTMKTDILKKTAERENTGYTVRGMRAYM